MQNVSTRFTTLQAGGINYSRLSCVQWLSVIKLFELEVSVRKISEQLNTDHETIYNTAHLIRLAVLSHAEDAEKLFSEEIEVDESYFGSKRKGKRGRGTAGKVLVFGILERKGKVRVIVVPNITAEDRFTFSLHVKRAFSNMALC